MVDGATENEGRIEVRRNNDTDNGNWGIVCDDLFDFNDGDVFCKMLGYGYTAAETIYRRSHFGHGNLEFHLDELECTGVEESFLECPANVDWGNVVKCGRNEAAGVRCYPGT